MTKPKVIQRGVMTYVIYPEKVLTAINMGQWSTYNQYNNWNRKGITEFADKLKKSGEHEYASPSEMMSLAFECQIKSSGTMRPKDLDL